MLYQKKRYILHSDDRRSCDLASSRHFRSYYTVPGCLPAMMELQPSNWLLLSRAYEQHLPEIDVGVL